MLDAVGEDEGTSRAGPEADHVRMAEDLYRRSYGDLVRLASLILGDRAAAEDVVQDAFAALCRRAPLSDPGGVEGYVRRSVANGSRDRLRRRRVERAPRSRRPVASRSTEDHAVAADDARAVAAALLQLPPRQRECAVWHYQLGLTHSEVATVLGISSGSVKTHLHRATRRLATLLEDHR